MGHLKILLKKQIRQTIILMIQEIIGMNVMYHVKHVTHMDLKIDKDVKHVSQDIISLFISKINIIIVKKI